jgi:hypothetical protein
MTPRLVVSECSIHPYFHVSLKDVYGLQQTMIITLNAFDDSRADIKESANPGFFSVVRGRQRLFCIVLGPDDYILIVGQLLETIGDWQIRQPLNPPLVGKDFYEDVGIVLVSSTAHSA